MSESNLLTKIKSRQNQSEAPTKAINKSDPKFKKSRMIVRNLVFDVNENMLKNLFFKFG